MSSTGPVYSPAKCIVLYHCKYTQYFQHADVQMHCITLSHYAAVLEAEGHVQTYSD